MVRYLKEKPEKQHFFVRLKALKRLAFDLLRFAAFSNTQSTVNEVEFDLAPMNAILH